MKIKFLPILLVSLLVTMSAMTSCLDNDIEQVTYSSETSITSFSLGTLHVKRVGKDSKGEDSTYTDTISMANYPFTINQAMRTIENKDSLPVGTDISRVLTKITADTDYILYGKIDSEGAEAKDTLWTSSDSINFAFAPTEGLSFKVLAYSGVMGKAYRVKINVHNQEPDSLQWTKEPIGAGFTSGTLIKQKAVYANDKIYVFGTTQNGKQVVEYTSVSNGTPGTSWTTINLPDATDTYSATLCQGNIYFLVEQVLYKLTDNGCEASSVSNLSQLLAGIDNLLYARTAKDESYVYDVQANSGTTENYNITDFPSKGTRTLSVNIPVSYNTSLTRAVVMGYNTEKADGSGIVSTRLTNDNTWSTYNYEEADTFRCPNIVDPSLIYYNKKLYVFGGEITSKDYTDYKNPFSTLFCSTDNGLTWETVKEDMTFATEGTSFVELYNNRGKVKGEGSYSCVVDKDNFIWIIWNNGYMSRGRINHFGFLPKWE